MAAKYIKPSSNLTPRQVWDKLMSGEWSFDDCPWVVIGNLCASVTFTGDGSWQSIARDLFHKGQKTFAVLCGRHGDQLGQEVDLKTGKFIKRDPTRPADTAIDPAADRKIAEALHGDPRLKGINIVVQDVGNGAHDSVQLLTNEIKSHLSANRIVILAWCYSLFAMKPGWDANVKNAWPQVFNGPDRTPIAWTAKDWAWLSSVPALPASIAALNQAVG